MLHTRIHIGTRTSYEQILSNVKYKRRFCFSTPFRLRSFPSILYEYSLTRRCRFEKIKGAWHCGDQTSSFERKFSPTKLPHKATRRYASRRPMVIALIFFHLFFYFIHFFSRILTKNSFSSLLFAHLLFFLFTGGHRRAFYGRQFSSALLSPAAAP